MTFNLSPKIGIFETSYFFIVTDGGGGWWWMVVDGGGGWVEKKFFDFSQNLHIDSTPRDNFLIFGVKRENFLMGLKIDFEFFEVRQFY